MSKAKRKVTQEIICFPFSLGIPWRLDKDEVIEPYMSLEVWRNFIKKNSSSPTATVVCPGYLLEAYVASFIPSILSKYNVKVDKWIMPKYYSSMVNFLSGLDEEIECTSDENIFEEYYRIKEAIDCYPVPIFFDEKDNTYLNVMFNYAETINFRNDKINRKSDIPLWKHMLDNLCVDCRFRNNTINNTQLSHRYKELLRKYGLSSQSKVVILDNSNVFGTLANGKVLNGKVFLEHEVNNLALRLAADKTQLLILTKNRVMTYSKNCFIANIWPRIDSFDLITLLASANCVISSDPNIYLVSMMVGCKNVIAVGNKITNMTFEDYFDISLCDNDGKYNYIKLSDFSVNNLYNHIVT